MSCCSSKKWKIHAFWGIFSKFSSSWQVRVSLLDLTHSHQAWNIFRDYEIAFIRSMIRCEKTEYHFFIMSSNLQCMEFAEEDGVSHTPQTLHSKTGSVHLSVSVNIDFEYRFAGNFEKLV